MDQFSSHPLYSKHDLDSAMSALWKFYKDNFLVLFLASFIMSLCMQLLTLTFDFRDLLNTNDPMEMMDKLREMIWPLVAISLVSLLCISILYYYVIYNPVDSNATIFVSIYKSLRYYILFLIIMVFFAVFASMVMIFGLMLLIVGVVFSMIYIMTLFLFFLPVMMVEGPDIANAISRTISLVHRSFWSNIGWVAVFLVILMIITMMLNTLIMLPFTGSFMQSLTNPDEIINSMDFIRNPVYITLSSLAGALYYPLIPILGTILYFNGRAKEEEKELINTKQPE